MILAILFPFFSSAFFIHPKCLKHVEGAYHSLGSLQSRSLRGRSCQGKLNSLISAVNRGASAGALARSSRTKRGILRSCLIGRSKRKFTCDSKISDIQRTLMRGGNKIQKGFSRVNYHRSRAMRYCPKAGGKLKCNSISSCRAMLKKNIALIKQFTGGSKTFRNAFGEDRNYRAPKKVRDAIRRAEARKKRRLARKSRRR